MSLNNINVMGWHTNPRYLNHAREYAMGSKYNLVVPLGRILPFVIPRTGTAGAGINRFTIYGENGQTYEARTQLQDAGLTYQNIGGADQVKFLDSSPLPGVWEPGCYRAVMSDGFTTWYSDWWMWTQDVENLVKIEWSHNTPLQLPGGTIQYGFPFKLRAYFKTDIAKPSYRFQEDVDRRESIDMPFLSISYKLYQFTVIAPEYLLDCLRLIPVHHNVEITHLGEVIEVDKITMGDAEWIERGDIAGVTFTFRAGSTVATYGERAGLNTVGPSIQCIGTTYEAERVVTIQELTNAGSIEELAAFVPNPPGYFLLEELVFFGETNSRTQIKYVADSSTVQNIQGQDGDVVFVNILNQYYLWHNGAFVPPGIASISDGPTYTLTGYVPAGTTVQIWFRIENGSWQIHSTHAAPAINAGVDLGTDASTWLQARLVLASASCGELQTTEAFTLNQPPAEELTGIGYQRISLTTTVG